MPSCVQRVADVFLTQYQILIQIIPPNHPCPKSMIVDQNRWCFPNIQIHTYRHQQMQEAFLTDPQELQNGLFETHIPRHGARTHLNVNCLPDFLQHVKRQLTAQQMLRLEDYRLQNYIVELALAYTEQPELVALTEHVLTHVRGSNDFWYKHNNQQAIDQEQRKEQRAVKQYEKDMSLLKQAFEGSKQKPYIPNYPHRSTVLVSYQSLNINQPHPRKDVLNHLAYVPPFLVENYQVNHIQKKLIESFLMFLVSNGTKKQKKDNKKASENLQSQSEDDEIQEEKKSQEIMLDRFLVTVSNQNLPKFPKGQHFKQLFSNFLTLGLRITQMEEPQLDLQFSGELPQSLEELLSCLSERSLTSEQQKQICEYYLAVNAGNLAKCSFDCRQKQLSSITRQGWLNSQVEISHISQGYSQMLRNPQFVELTRYRTAASGSGGVPWADQDYKRFLQGLLEFLNIPTNNKKIASYMGSSIEPNHVKHVKGVYLNLIKDRIERGQCGGGKRGRSISRSDFIQKDINSFSMKWFEKPKSSKKIKKKKARRHRNASASENDEDSMDSQY